MLKRYLSILLVALAFASPVLANVHIRPINVATTIDFKLYNADGTLDVDEVDGGTEVSVSCAGGAETTATNDFVDEGTFYSIALTQAEMNCARIAVIIAATTTEVVFIDTYGASAAIPGIPAAVPGAAGGLLIAGTNADFDVTANASFAGGVTITQSTSNAAALVVTGNGTGNGATFTSGSGATGNGITAAAASTNGNGFAMTGTGTGSGNINTGGATGHGILTTGGSTSGDGLRATAATSGKGINAIGIGTTQPGFLATGGATTSAGAQFIGGSTSGAGILAQGTAGNSPALNLVGQGSAAGLLSTGGATGPGASLVGGSTSGAGLAATGSAGNANGATFTANGTGSGALFASGAGATGNGAQFTANSTNGNGIGLTATGTGATMTLTPANVTQFGGSAGTFSSGRPEVLLGNLPAQCIAAMGCSAQGTLSGTHSSTTADLGGSAPGATSDLVGKTLDIPAKFFSRTITAYDTSTGIATFDTTSLTLANSDQWYLYDTAASSGGGGSGATAAEVWSYSTRRLTDATNIVSSGTSIPMSSGRVDASVGAYQSGMTPLQPTTAGRTLDVTATGEAGIDWANVGSPTTSVNFSGTTFATLTNAPADSSGITTLLSRLSSTRAGYLDNLSAGAVAQASALSTLAGYVDTESAASLAILQKLDTGMELDGSVYRFTTNALEMGPAGGGGGTNITQIEGVDATDQIDARIAAAALATASNLAAVNTKLGTPAGASVSADIAAAKADTAAIKVKSDSLTFTVGGLLDVNAEAMNGYTILGAGTTASPWNGE